MIDAKRAVEKAVGVLPVQQSLLVPSGEQPIKESEELVAHGVAGTVAGAEVSKAEMSKALLLLIVDPRRVLMCVEYERDCSLTNDEEGERRGS